MPRLFFAIETPPNLKAELIRLQGSLEEVFLKSNPIPNLKPEKLENSHCTVRFLGNVEESKINTIIDTARDGIEDAKIHAFEYKLTRCGVFPNARIARVSWIGLTPEEPFQQIQRAIDVGLTLAGIPFKQGLSFHPHLTLFRFRNPYNFPQDFAFPDLIRHSPIASCSKVILVESKTLPDGPVLTVRAKFELP